MKIAFLSFYSGLVDRGVEVATQALAQGLAKKFSTTVFQSGKRVVPNVTIVILPVTVSKKLDSSPHFLKSVYVDYFSLKILIFTLKWLPYFFREQYDVVIPTNGGWQVVICRLACWILGKQLIVQGNAGIGRDDRWQMLWQPNRFIAISPAGFEWAKHYYSPAKISFIPYGVDVAAISRAKVHAVDLKKPIALCVAAFLPYKRLELLIYAMKEVPEASLLLIGHGPLEQKLRDLGAQLLPGRFMLVTNVSHEQLLGYYKCARVFSLPSKESEAFGIVYIEALAANLPIVATNDENRRYLVNGAGILVNPEIISDYSDALKKVLYTDFDNQPRIQAAKFSWSEIVKQYTLVLNELNQGRV
ncbi:TPA: hypothetical protein DIV55_02550 [Patescibacteria group bacterium]|uniref:Glycosyl transferase, group 1 n=1 Tax=Candidatus Gottesmanbacteria bacterium GW2011_GWA1_43_11 TaxID=1618436 RepID=A0A0G1CKF8_9BACT|nr:MAG: Glycosyl transferase, group 1 [Candidatus Gottesmanbacteria bacterium GW2011_GWA1_43_11]HCS78600.1 hypothetical protein [Patescibacteria group bacterium]